jgi:hypothetical protein
MSTIDMETPVRRSLTKEVVIANPLANAVTFTVSCTSPEIIVPHSCTVQAKYVLSIFRQLMHRSEGICSFEFLPLMIKESMAKLTFTSNEIGVYQYDLKLNAQTPSPERSLQFTVGLGSAQTQTFRFLSYAKTKSEYTFRIDNPDFTVEKTLAAPAGIVSSQISQFNTCSNVWQCRVEH